MIMSTSMKTLGASILLVASIAGRGGASAAPVIDHLAFKNASPSAIEFVQWRGGWGWGAPAAGGFVAGALVGSALAAPYYYGPGPYYPYYPSPYYPPAPAGYYAPGSGPPPAGDAVAYCEQRFRSYNPKTGLYIGTDGHLHPCP